MQVVEGVGEMKDHYFLYALIVLVAILGLMMAGAVVYIGVLQAENEFLTEENQKLEERHDEISDEIRVLSDRIEEITSDVNHSEDWNKEAF
jgi:FtsZ-binding cell division protein ZapB